MGHQCQQLVIIDEKVVVHNLFNGVITSSMLLPTKILYTDYSVGLNTGLIQIIRTVY